MAVGTNIKYVNGPDLLAILKKYLGQDREGLNPAGYSSLPSVCVKVSATAPTNSNGDDEPNAIGDICLHYSVAGVLQGAYICTSTETPTWVKLRA